MPSIVGNPWVGLVSLGVYAAAFVLQDGLNSAAKAGQDIPELLPSVVRAVAVICIFGVALGQRHSRLNARWRTANTLVLLLLAVQVWVVVSMWGLPATSAKAGPREAALLLAFLIALATAVQQPGSIAREPRAGVVAAALIAVPGFLGLIISSRFSTFSPRPFEPTIVLVSAMAAAFAVPFAYDFGSRLRPAGREPRP